MSCYSMHLRHLNLDSATYLNSHMVQGTPLRARARTYAEDCQSTVMRVILSVLCVS